MVGADDGVQERALADGDASVRARPGVAGAARLRQVEDAGTGDAPDVTVVLPVFNEVGCVADELRRIRVGLEASPYTWEVVVVDDGSTDGSPAVLDGFDWIRRVTFDTNRGSGAARRAGTAAARGEVCVWTDADMTYPNDRIAELVAQLGTADQVVGARTSEAGSMRLLRSPAKWLIREAAQRLTGTRIPDLNSGFRAFRRTAVVDHLPLLPPGFSCVTTVTLAMLLSGQSVRYHPVPYRRRVGRSKFHPVRDTYRYAVQLLRIVTFFTPLRVFLPIALGLLAVGAAKLGFDLVVHPLRIATNTLLLLLGGLHVLALGLLADLVVARTGRPGGR